MASVLSQLVSFNLFSIEVSFVFSVRILLFSIHHIRLYVLICPLQEAVLGSSSTDTIFEGHRGTDGYLVGSCCLFLASFEPPLIFATISITT